jgi:REP element-mobilizing transposase RayT
MARPLRIQAPGLTYHVTSRGVRRANIFIDDRDRREFLRRLGEIVQRFALICHAYCEMTNHYHLAVTTTEANLSEAMKRLNGGYAQWWNWRHEGAGRVYEAPFGAQIVQDDGYLLNVCKYIVLNPVRAGMVDWPEEWSWSSYRAMVGLEPMPAFMDFRRVLAATSPDDPAEGGRYLHEALRRPDARALRIPRTTIVGDDEFIARIAAFRAIRGPVSREVPRREGRRPLDIIFRGAVTREARNEAIAAALRDRWLVADVARYLGLHPTTVSKAASVAEALAAVNAGNGVRP